MIKGIDVVLYVKAQNGVDEFNKPKYTESAVTVSNVLVEPVGSEAVINTESLEEKKETYRLCIPKGDNHSWENCKVVFWNKTWKTVGFTQEYIEDNLPLLWNKKIMVERYG